jgi:hypothetical protein
MPPDSVEEPRTKGSAKRTALRRGVKELRTELYRALPSTACRATKVFYGEITKRATEASVLSQPMLSSKPDGAESQLRSEPARFYVLGWWTRSAGPTAMIPSQIAVLYRQGQSTSPTEHEVNCWNMGTLSDRPSPGSSSKPRKTGHGQLRGRSLRSSPSTGKPCTWRRQAGNRWGLR